MGKRRFVEGEIVRTFESYNYRPIQVPTFEHAELFSLKSGEEIRQHMYVFRDKSDRELCLRPEATASVCRMFVENFQNTQMPLKFYYMGPMFRYERPQKGRYREFWQAGVELIGPSGARSDAEVISMASKCLENIGLKFELEVGHLGILRGLMRDLGIGAGKQDELINAMDKGETERLENLVEHEVLLDIIGLNGQKDAVERAKTILNSYPSALSALEELSQILSLLDENATSYVVNMGVARGLEYYTGMVFEIMVNGLGAQSQICGGGRYDLLIELFGGKTTPAVGFAFGFDRVVDAFDEQGIKAPEAAVDFVVAPVSDEIRKDADRIASELRKQGASVDIDLMDRKLGKIMEYAANVNALQVVIVGPKELAKSEVTLRDMKTGGQENVKIANLKFKIEKRNGK
ncbi:MAG: histidine--tRNA ligase [Candidatus Altiarchaeales archaeon IMC4]|nr:MAG: histidine--tRNA ligase [Candidatus Altiarchaeales archaeon IMC4]